MFLTNKGIVTISAPDLQSAKEQFQERYGYWPEEEPKNVKPNSEARTPQEAAPSRDS
jgi:hypothetical protein